MHKGVEYRGDSVGKYSNERAYFKASLIEGRYAMKSVGGVATLYHCSALRRDVFLKILLKRGTKLPAGTVPLWRKYAGKNIGYQEIKSMIKGPRHHVGIYTNSPTDLYFGGTYQNESTKFGFLLNGLLLP